MLMLSPGGPPGGGPAPRPYLPPGGHVRFSDGRVSYQLLHFKKRPCEDGGYGPKLDVMGE